MVHPDYSLVFFHPNIQSPTRLTNVHTPTAAIYLVYHTFTFSLSGLFLTRLRRLRSVLFAVNVIFTSRFAHNLSVLSLSPLMYGRQRIFGFTSVVVVLALLILSEVSVLLLSPLLSSVVQELLLSLLLLVFSFTKHLLVRRVG